MQRRLSRRARIVADVPRYWGTMSAQAGATASARAGERRDGGSTWTDAPAAGRHRAPPVARALSAGQYARGAGQPVRNALGPGQGARHTQHHAARRDLPEQDTAVFSSPAGMAASSARRITSCPVSAPMNLILWNCPTDGFSSSGDVQGHSGGAPVRHALSGRLAERHAVPPSARARPGTRCSRDPQGGMCPRPLHGTHSGAASWVTGATNAFHSPTITVKNWTRIGAGRPVRFPLPAPSAGAGRRAAWPVWPCGRRQRFLARMT